MHTCNSPGRGVLLLFSCHRWGSRGSEKREVAWWVSKNGNVRLWNQTSGPQSPHHQSTWHWRERSEEDNRIFKAPPNPKVLSEILPEPSHQGWSLLLRAASGYQVGSSGIEMCGSCCSQGSHQSYRMIMQIWFWFIDVYFQPLVLMYLTYYINC